MNNRDMAALEEAQVLFAQARREAPAKADQLLAATEQREDEDIKQDG